MMCAVFSIRQRAPSAKECGYSGGDRFFGQQTGCQKQKLRSQFVFLALVKPGPNINKMFVRKLTVFSRLFFQSFSKVAKKKTTITNCEKKLRSNKQVAEFVKTLPLQQKRSQQS
eukprot:GEMP01101472.1.p2 GENE.GEMP01101472.1~~GEMP01101472.1.p2  ORF type:complete len:114 (-),score=1.56 GEMP01101472.1:299-640(-)